MNSESDNVYWYFHQCYPFLNMLVLKKMKLYQIYTCCSNWKCNSTVAVYQMQWASVLDDIYFSQLSDRWQYICSCLFVVPIIHQLGVHFLFWCFTKVLELHISPVWSAGDHSTNTVYICPMSTLPVYVKIVEQWDKYWIAPVTTIIFTVYPFHCMTCRLLVWFGRALQHAMQLFILLDM